MKKMVLQALTVTLLLAAFTFPARLTAGAAKIKMTCPTPIPVTIDIKPGSYPNTIKLSSQGLVPVAVLTTQDFDSSLFIPEMAHLTDANTDMTDSCSGAMAVRWEWEDVNGDGMVDLVFFFSTLDLNFTTSTTSASLMAHGAYGSTTVHILGTDSVNVIP